MDDLILQVMTKYCGGRIMHAMHAVCFLFVRDNIVGGTELLSIDVELVQILNLVPHNYCLL